MRGSENGALNNSATCGHSRAIRSSPHNVCRERHERPTHGLGCCTFGDSSMLMTIAPIKERPAATAVASAAADMHAMVGLAPLMAASEGSTSVTVAVIDGPVDRTHPALTSAQIEVLGDAACEPLEGVGCRHGTFTAGLLVAARSEQAPGICPGCRLLAYSVFAAGERDSPAPSAQPKELAAAILEVVAAGARIINLSLALLEPGPPGAAVIQMALDAAMQHGVLVAAASGNQGVVGSTAITRHPWVIPVAACSGGGLPLAPSNFAASVGRNGLLAPGEGIRGVKAGGGFDIASGTSVAVPFVAGALALLASLCPWASAAELRRAVAASGIRRRSVVPPLLNAATAWQILMDGRR